MNREPERPRGSGLSRADSLPDGLKRTTTDALLGRDGRLFIEHRGDYYVLRVTRQGRLILTK